MGSIVVLDATTGKPVFRQERGHTGSVGQLMFLSEFEVVTGGTDQKMNVWSLPRGAVSATNKGGRKHTVSLAAADHGSGHDGPGGIVTGLAIAGSRIITATSGTAHHSAVVCELASSADYCADY